MPSHVVPAAKIFAALHRLLLPHWFYDALGNEQRLTQATAARAARVQGGLEYAQFWLNEFGGLAKLAFTQRVDAHRERAQFSVPSRYRKRNPDMLHELRKDLQFAFRMIRKTPVLAAIAIVSVALGVAINVSTFSLLNSWLVRPLPYPDAGRLTMLYEVERSRPDDLDGATVANFFDWREQATSFETWIATRFGIVNLTGVDRPEQLTIADVTPNFFSVLGARTMLGRTFSSDEGGEEDAAVAVLGETLWRTKFGADSSVIGQTITLDGEGHTVVGVVPETFDFLFGSVTLWRPNDFVTDRDDREAHVLNVTGKLKRGSTITQAQAEMSRIASELEELFPDQNRDRTVNAQTIREQFPGPTDRALILILSTVVFLALLIACANVATLLLAKTDARQKELAVRLALGAGRRRIMQQLLTESVILALIAGGLGMVLSVFGVQGIAGAMPDVVPGSFAPRFDTNVIIFGALVSVVAGLTFGITPAIQAVSGNLRSTLIDGVRGGTVSKRKRRIRNAFVVAEFAMALVILIGAAVMTDMFGRSLNIDAGYDASNILTVEFTIPEHRYADDAAIVQLTDDISRELDGLSGVSVWAFANRLPRTFGLPRSNFTIDGQPVEEGSEPLAAWLSVTPDYLATLSIPMVSGRAIDASDRDDAPPVVLINQQFVDRFLDGEAPLGDRITINDASREIVGVVQNVAQTRLAGIQPVQPAVYFPMAQRPVRRIRALLKTESNPHDLTSAVQSAAWRVDPEQPITAVQTLEEFIEIQLAGPDMLNDLLFTVGFLALALSAIGIYGVMAYSVSQQTNELGIRMALGAKPVQLLTKVTRQGAVLAGIGLLVGTPAALLVTRAIMSLPAGIPGVNLEEVTISLGPIVQVSAILVGVGLIACFLPARRATRIDPALALREE